jgi:hypothetical protein
MATSAAVFSSHHMVEGQMQFAQLANFSRVLKCPDWKIDVVTKKIGIGPGSIA